MVKNKTFTYELNLGAGSFQYFDLENNVQTDAYTPIKNITIINTGQTEMRVYINDSKNYIVVPKGTIYSDKGRHIYSVKIVNKDASNTITGYLTLDNKITELDLLKMLVFGYKEVKEL